MAGIGLPDAIHILDRRIVRMAANIGAHVMVSQNLDEAIEMRWIGAHRSLAVPHASAVYVREGFNRIVPKDKNERLARARQIFLQPIQRDVGNIRLTDTLGIAPIVFADRGKVRGAEIEGIGEVATRRPALRKMRNAVAGPLPQPRHI